MDRKLVLRSKHDIDSLVKEVSKDIAEIVGATHGPGGRPVLIKHMDRTPEVTKDGVTVAKAIGYKNIDKDTIAKVIIQASEECGNIAGDGTTTTIILADAFINELNSLLVQDRTRSTQEVLRQIEKIVETRIIPFIEQESRPVKNLEDLKHVAIISSNGDPEISESLIQAFDMVGEDGEITVEEGYPGKKTMSVKHTPGFSGRKGWKDLGVSGGLFVDQDSQQFRADKVLVACFDGNIEQINQVVPLMEAVATFPVGQRPPVVLVAHSFSADILKLFILNKSSVNIYPMISEANYMPNSAQHFLHDLATYTDGEAFNGVNNPMAGEDLLERLGQAVSVTSGKYQTTFYAYPNEERLGKHIAALKEQMPALESDYDRDGQKKRISRLVGGIAVINLSTPTPAEFKEIRARIDDALCSIRSAQESGIVPGGGTTLLRAAVSLLQEDTNLFNQAIAKSLKAPIETLLKNSGIIEFPELIKGLARMKSPAAYDARNHKTVLDAFESGIVDPTKVAVVSLRSALSIANTLCNLGGLVTFEKQEQENDKRHPIKMD